MLAANERTAGALRRRFPRAKIEFLVEIEAETPEDGGLAVAGVLTDEERPAFAGEDGELQSQQAFAVLLAEIQVFGSGG